MRLVELVLGRRVDVTRERTVKFFPNEPPRRGDIVVVDGVRCRVTYARHRFDPEPVPHPKYGLNSPLYRWHLLALRVKEEA